jgi:hypothetical protein
MVFACSDIDRIEFAGHPVPPEPEQPPEMEDVVVTPESFFGMPDPSATPGDNERVILRTRKPPETEKTKKGG